MPVEYRDATKEVYDLMDRVIEDYYPVLNLLSIPLRIDIQMASSDGEGPAVKHHGHAAAATIKLIQPQEKAKTGLDLRITIDRARWLDMDDDERTALMHHELGHPEPQYDDEGSLKIDPYGRPKLKIKLDDWCLTGFLETVRIFGPKAIERQSLTHVEEMLRQQSLPFIAAKPDADAASIVNDHLAEVEAEAAEDDIAHQAFEALISVGHTPDQARAAIDRVLASGKRPGSVAAFVEAVYNDTEIRKPAGAETVVTLSAGGRSVTMTPDQMDRVADGDIPKPRGKGKRPAIVGAEAGA